MRITYDPAADALYLYLTPTAGEDGAAVETVEIAPNVHADYDAAGTLLGIEVLGAGGLSVETLAAGAMAGTSEEAAWRPRLRGTGCRETRCLDDERPEPAAVAAPDAGAPAAGGRGGAKCEPR